MKGSSDSQIYKKIHRADFGYMSFSFEIRAQLSHLFE